MTDETLDDASLSVYVHELGICESRKVGSGTRIWAFAHVLPGARIGTNCNICNNTFIEDDVVVGNDVTIKCGVQLWDGLRVGDRVFIGPNATFTNDRSPRSKVRPETFLITVVEDDASIGANATILPGLRIGRGAMVGAGAVVTRDVPAFATVVGNPARIVSYQKSPGARTAAEHAPPGEDQLDDRHGARLDLGVGNCFLQRLPNYIDMRGSLTALESANDLPFEPVRVFLVHSVRSGLVRGAHAHRQCKQFLLAAHAGVSVVVDDGRSRVEVRLSDPTMGLYLPPMIWGIQYKFDPDTVLMVLASRPYEAEDYIRDYNAFLSLVESR